MLLYQLMWTFGKHGGTCDSVLTSAAVDEEDVRGTAAADGRFKEDFSYSRLNLDHVPLDVFSLTQVSFLT